MKEVGYESSYAEDFRDISAAYLTLWDSAILQQLTRLQDLTDPEGHTVDFVSW